MIVSTRLDGHLLRVLDEEVGHQLVVRSTLARNLSRRGNDIIGGTAKFIGHLGILHVAAVEEEEAPVLAHLLETLGQIGDVQPTGWFLDHLRALVVAIVNTIGATDNILSVVLQNPAIGVAPEDESIVLRLRTERNHALKHLLELGRFGAVEISGVFI